MDQPMPNTVEFKVDMLFKVVVLGLLTLAGKLSWDAYEENRRMSIAMGELLNAINTRVTVSEYRLNEHDERIAEAIKELKDLKRNPR